MKLAKKLALTLCAVLLIGSIGYIPPVEAKAAADWTRGLNGAMGWNEDTYYTIEKRTATTESGIRPPIPMTRTTTASAADAAWSGCIG